MQKSSTQVRGRISPDLQDLQALHEQHWWIPSPEQIRPSDAVRAAKDEALEKISREYSSPTDFVLIQVFGAPSARLEDGKLSVLNASTGKKLEGNQEWTAEDLHQVFSTFQMKPYKFVANEYPYSLHPGGRHWVLWYNSVRLLKSDQEVSRDIAREIKRCLVQEKALERKGGEGGWGGTERQRDAHATTTETRGALATSPCCPHPRANAAAAQEKEPSDVTDDLSLVDFAWYENPKMTIPQLSHVQVFWVTKP